MKLRATISVSDGNDGQRDHALLPLAFAGGTKAMALTPIVGAPKREYAEVFVPGEETIDVGELRMTALGSGNP